VSIMERYYRGRCQSGGLVVAALAVVVLVCGGARGIGPRYKQGVKTGKVANGKLNEISGIAASRVNPGLLWVHNDSGDSAKVYGLDEKGNNVAEFTLAGAKARDWEDIAVGPGPDPNDSYIYAGDIGDNHRRRKTIAVYRFAEPKIKGGQKPFKGTIEVYDRLELAYPQGPRNAETLMVDPVSRDIYIVTKSPRTEIYTSAYPQSTDEVNRLQRVGEIEWSTAVGGDISTDGRLIIIRSNFFAYVWVRAEGQALWEALEGQAYAVPLRFEPQGEAIGFAANGRGYYTVSEHKHQPIYYFQEIETKQEERN